MEANIIISNKVYNVEEAAKLLSINPQTMLEYVRDGKIVAQKIGEWKILGKNLVDFLSKRTYLIITKQGVTGKVKAKNQDELFKKLSTGQYGVLPVHGNTVIPYTPENIKEIVELSDNDEFKEKLLSEEVGKNKQNE